MYKDFIKNNISNLSEELIKEYAKKVNIPITTSETHILYQFIMKNYSEILDGNEKSFSYLKEKLNPNLYYKIYNLYNEYKKYL